VCYQFGSRISTIWRSRLRVVLIVAPVACCIWHTPAPPSKLALHGAASWERRRVRKPNWTHGAPKRRVFGTLFSSEIIRTSIGIGCPLCSSGMRWASRMGRPWFAWHAWMRCTADHQRPTWQRCDPGFIEEKHRDRSRFSRLAPSLSLGDNVRPTQLDGRSNQRPPHDSARSIQRWDDVSPVFIERVPPRSTTWLAGFHVETQTMLSMALQAVRKSVL